MSKRFTETQKWQDAWFMDLPAKWKLAWFWILDNCDHAGIVEANPRLMAFVIGEPIDGDEFIRVMGGRVTKPKLGKWFIPKFIEFQYGTSLNTQNSAHKGVLKKLADAGIDCPVDVIDSTYQGAAKPLPSPCQGAQDKDKDKDKDKETDKGGSAEGCEELPLGDKVESPKRFTPPSPQAVTDYSASIGYPLNGEAWCDSYAQKGWKVGRNPMKDWKAAVRNWKTNGYTLGNGHAPPVGTPVEPIKPRIPDNLRDEIPE